MVNTSLYIEKYWTPDPEDRRKITDLLAVIKAAGSVDSDESIRAQNTLLKFYYPTLVKIAERHFEKRKHKNIGASFDVEDLVSKAFMYAVKNILNSQAEPSIAVFNNRFIGNVVTGCIRKLSLLPSVNDGRKWSDRVGENDSSGFYLEVRDFWAAFKGRLVVTNSKANSLPYHVNPIDLEIIDRRLEEGDTLKDLAVDHNIALDAVRQREVKILAQARRFLVANKEDFPDLYAFAMRVEKEKLGNSGNAR